jgi:hypothetical protein
LITINVRANAGGGQEVVNVEVSSDDLLLFFQHLHRLLMAGVVVEVHLDGPGNEFDDEITVEQMPGRFAWLVDRVTDQKAMS